MILLVFLLLQGSQEESLERRVEHFVAGDDAQAEPIRSAGPSAMLLLRLHRASRTANDLMREIRERAASVEDRAMAKKLGGFKVIGEGNKTTFAEALDALSGSAVRWVIDPREGDSIGSREVTPPKGGSGLDVLEDVCAQANVDFAYLYGLVLIAPPERLWLPPPPRTRPLTKEEKTRAKALVSRLGAESPEDRDRAAAELLKLGPPVIPLLEAGAADKDSEVAGRCRDLAAKLRPPLSWVFGPASVERQKLQGADATAYATLKQRTMTFKVKDLHLNNCLKLLLTQVDGDTLAGEYPAMKLSFSFEDLPLTSVLAVLTQSVGMDYMIAEGRVLAGPRAEILRRIPAEK